MQSFARSLTPVTMGTLTIDEFFEAFSGTDESYELVGGFARPLAHANPGHNVVRTKVLAALAPSSKRKGYRAKSVRTGVRTGLDTIRYPDTVVDGSPFDGAATTASSPAIIAEIFSFSALDQDRAARLREFQSLKSVSAVPQIEAEAQLVTVHRRHLAGMWAEAVG